MTRFTYFIVVALMSAAMAGEAAVVEFHIPAGTGKKPWNTRQTTVEVKVGQTLRLINDDVTKHRMHTNDGKPCAHAPANLEKGTQYDCVVTQVADPDVDLCYDHNVGPSARFYVRATN